MIMRAYASLDIPAEKSGDEEEYSGYVSGLVDGLHEACEVHPVRQPQIYDGGHRTGDHCDCELVEVAVQHESARVLPEEGSYEHRTDLDGSAVVEERECPTRDGGT
jgi:hypothetical protein